MLKCPTYRQHLDGWDKAGYRAVSALSGSIIVDGS